MENKKQKIWNLFRDNMECFLTYCFFGWVYESIWCCLIYHRRGFINRGFLFGPWLPIYGVGGLLIIVGLRPLRKNPGLLFMGAFAACGALEYFAAWALETLFHTKWWDYTGYFLNVNGRICLEGLFVFGLAGVAFTYLFAPMLDNLYKKIKPNLIKPICVILLVLFAIDLGYSAFHPNAGAGVTYGDTQIDDSIAETETADQD